MLYRQDKLCLQIKQAVEQSQPLLHPYWHMSYFRWFASTIQNILMALSWLLTWSEFDDYKDEKGFDDDFAN
jgi:hypothetical protein